MNEPQSFQTGDAMTVTATTDATARFEHGDDMRDLYEQMRPDQRTAIAGELIRLLTLAGDDHVEPFRQQLQRHIQVTTDETDELLSADEVARIDSYVRQKHPELTLPTAEAGGFLGRTPRTRQRTRQTGPCCDRLPCSLAAWLSPPLHRREFPEALR